MSTKRAITSAVTRGRKPIDLTGRTYGRLTVLKRVPFLLQGHVYWGCRCSCGKEEVYVAHSNLQGGQVKSCGSQCPERCEGSPLKGTKRTQGKLTSEVAAAIRSVGSAPGANQRKIAKQYGVSRLTVHKIVNGQTHKQKDGNATS